MSQWNKLKSRKLWAMITAVLIILSNAVKTGILTETDIIAIVTSIVIYILAETGVDIYRQKGQ